MVGVRALLTLKNVTIVKLDLEGKERRYAGRKSFGLRHFIVADSDGNQTFIRLTDAYVDKDYIRPSEVQEREMTEIAYHQVGDRVTVDVQPVDWTIGNQTGTSYLYRAIRGV